MLSTNQKLLLDQSDSNDREAAKLYLEKHSLFIGQIQQTHHLVDNLAGLMKQEANELKKKSIEILQLFEVKMNFRPSQQ